MRKRILITVTTYPLPSSSYAELVCTAGFDEGGNFIRIYPIPLSALINKRFRKYDWIELDLEERPKKKDFRPNTYSPVDRRLFDLEVISNVDTERGTWITRKSLCLKKVYSSLDILINDAYSKDKHTSLAVFKPVKFIDFIVKEDDREWKPQWEAELVKQSLFSEEEWKRLGIKKVPSKFYYKFEDDKGKESTMMIEDWEIGQLYWNCLKRNNGDEEKAVAEVEQKYRDEFLNKKDLYLFLGTTLEWHKRKGKNPFMIIGVFYPPKDNQMTLL